MSFDLGDLFRRQFTLESKQQKVFVRMAVRQEDRCFSFGIHAGSFTSTDRANLIVPLRTASTTVEILIPINSAISRYRRPSPRKCRHSRWNGVRSRTAER